MTEYNPDIIGGIDIICSHMLPPNTIYCSEDIFLALQQSTKPKGILPKLIELYKKGDVE